MAYVKYTPGTLIAADNEYWIDVVPQVKYSFTLRYIAGTGTVTVQDGRNYDSSTPAAPETVSTFTLPGSPSSNMALTATGTAKGYDVRCNGNRLVFAVSSSSGLGLRIDVGVVPNGR